MGFAEYFPVIRKLTPAQRKRIEESVTEKKVPKGTVIHDGTTGCTGLLVVRSGLLRAYMLSDEGREITLYRLFVSRTGMSPQNYLIACRLREALARLHAGEPLKTIAFECGFSDQNYFTRIFRKKYGIPPAQFRRRC